MLHESRAAKFAEHPELENSERQPCEIWTRVMGYHRPAASFNRGKQGEFQERQYFKESSGAGAATSEAECTSKRRAPATSYFPSECQNSHSTQQQLPTSAA